MTENDKEGEIQAVKDKLAELTAYYEGRNLRTLPYGGCFQKTFDKLKQAQKGFAGQSLSLMMGPLKMGKSSLTNLLAQKYVKGVAAAVRDCATEFENGRQELDRLKEECDERIKGVEEPGNIWGNVRVRFREGAVKAALEKNLEDLIKAWRDDCCQRYLDREFLNAGLDVKSKKEDFEARVNEVIDAVNSQYNMRFSGAFAQYRQAMQNLTEEYMNWFWAGELDELNASLQELEIAPIKPEVCFVPEVEEFLFAGTGSPAMADISDAIRKTGGFHTRAGKEKRIADLWERLQRQYEDYAGQLPDNMAIVISQQFDGWIQDDYRKKITDYIGAQTAARLNEIKEDKEKMEEAGGYIAELESMCRGLLEACEQIYN